MTEFQKEFEDQCAAQFASDTKIGLLTSIAPDGYPHTALITTITVKSKTSFMWGQFSSGLVKDYLAANPKAGFLVISPDQHWWTGKSLHTGTAIKGADFDFFNNKPTYRYNAYYGIGVVHYHDLVDVSRGQAFDMQEIIAGVTQAAAIAPQAARPAALAKMPPFGMALAADPGTMKFISYVDADGYPRIIPAFQSVPADAGRFVVAPSPNADLLEKIPPGAKVALYLVNLSCQGILAQGVWPGFTETGGLRGAVLDIDKVYNTNLPLCRYIYPPEELPNIYGLTA